MKKIIFFIISFMLTCQLQAHSGSNYVHSNIFETLSAGDKIAIVMVHFGTTHSDTQAMTIDVINRKVAQEFSSVKVCEAYTSRIIIKRLGQRGFDKKNPSQVLKQLHGEGYTHILMQPTTISDGIELESIKREAEAMKTKFKEIRLGEPLLYTAEHYKELIDVLVQTEVANTAYLWVGHGTYKASTAQYAMLDYMFKSEGHNQHFVTTIEGYPDYDTTLKMINKAGLKKIVLMPLMFVAGDHAKNDIADDLKKELEEKGYTVEVRLEGLGQSTAVQDLYIQHLKFMIDHKAYDIMDKKAIYEQTGKKIK